jgi:hypothetical protein
MENNILELPKSLSNLLPTRGTVLKDSDKINTIPSNVSSRHKAIILKYYLNNVQTNFELLDQELDPVGTLFVISSPLFCTYEKLSSKALSFVKKWNRSRNTLYPIPTLCVSKSLRDSGNYEFTISQKLTNGNHTNMVNETLLVDEEELLDFLELLSYVSVIESNGRKLW